MPCLRPSSLRLALLTFALLALNVPQMASAQPAPTQYTILSVPDPWSIGAFGLNNHGQVVGEAFRGNAEPYGFLTDSCTMPATLLVWMPAPPPRRSQTLRPWRST